MYHFLFLFSAKFLQTCLCNIHMYIKFPVNIINIWYLVAMYFYMYANNFYSDHCLRFYIHICIFTIVTLFFQKWLYTSWNAQSYQKSISRSHSFRDKKGLVWLPRLNTLIPQWPKYFGLRHLIQEVLRSINKRHPAFFAKIIQSQGVFSLNADTPSTPTFGGIHSFALSILWKIGHTCPIYII